MTPGFTTSSHVLRGAGHLPLCRMATPMTPHLCCWHPLGMSCDDIWESGAQNGDAVVVPPLTLSSMRTHSKLQRSPEDTKISPVFKVPQGRCALASPECASIPPGSEILLEVGLSTFVSSREGLWFLTPPTTPALPLSSCLLPGHKSLQDPIRPSSSLPDLPCILLFLERFQHSPTGCSQC